MTNKDALLLVVAVVMLAVCSFILGHTTARYPEQSVQQPSPRRPDYDKEIRRQTYMVCLDKIKNVADLNQWYELASNCGQKARQESSE